VLREAARVLRLGGRFAVSDVIADPDMDDQTRADMAAWTGCVAGALTEAQFRGTLEAAGFTTKVAISMLKLGIGKEEAQHSLSLAGGHLRDVLGD